MTREEFEKCLLSLMELSAQSVTNISVVGALGTAINTIMDGFDKIQNELTEAKAALSAIDYMMGEPNEKRISLFDTDNDINRVKKNVFDLIISTSEK